MPMPDVSWRPIPMPSKPLWQSKTIWLNVLAIVLLILATPEIVGVLPSDWRPAIAAIAGVLNIVNRFLTTAPVSLTGGSDRG